MRPQYRASRGSCVTISPSCEAAAAVRGIRAEGGARDGIERAKRSSISTQRWISCQCPRPHRRVVAGLRTLTVESAGGSRQLVRPTRRTVPLTEPSSDSESQPSVVVPAQCSARP